MNGEFPPYYSRLAPFNALFEQGNPILTYHKLGPRPSRARVRLKGMYLSERLFARQLAELRLAGFQNGSLLACATTQSSRRIVLTFDDAYVNVLRLGLKPLAASEFKAIQFVVADRLGKNNDWDVALGEAPEPLMDKEQLLDWLAAGHDIGSHTLSHPYLTRVPPGQAQEEIIASRKRLEDLFGRPIEHFCYPYGDWDESVRDQVVAGGYKTACTTDTGINRAGDSLFTLKRFTARYPSRSLRALWSRLVGQLPGSHTRIKS
jgi:peptidoglycan/xylan/chitin deacetylase (PgdA/CDA1 family)